LHLQNSVVLWHYDFAKHYLNENNMKLSYFFLMFFAFMGIQQVCAQNYTRAEILSKDEKLQKRMLELPGLILTDLISPDWQQKKAAAGPDTRVISDSIFYRTGYMRKLHILQFPERYVVIPDAHYVRPLTEKKQ
jgi:hypothetical protein